MPTTDIFPRTEVISILSYRNMYCTCEKNQTTSLRGATNCVFKADNGIKFEFVSAESSKKTATRSKIRSHVMKHVKDIQALEQATSFRQQQATWRLDESTSDGLLSQSHGNSAQNCPLVCARCDKAARLLSHMRTTNRKSQIQPALRGLPINCIEGSTLLFDYLGNVYSYILNFSWERGQSLRASCLPYMVSGPAVLNSVLSVMAVNRMLMSGPSPHLITVFYHHKIEAIRVIRKSLQDARDPTSISDDALIAIATLSILESCTGFIATGRRHLDAFDKLSKSRGDASQSTANIFQTGLINLAQFAGRDFPLTPRAIEELPMTDLLSQIPQGAHSTLTTMFHELKCLSLDMIPSSEVMPEAEWLQRLNALGLSMHRMMAGDFFETRTDNMPLRAYSIVGNIFLCLFLRELPLSSPIYDYLLDCLSHALEEKDIRKDLRWYPDRFLLWLLFVSGASAAGRVQQGRFRAQIPAVQARLNLETWTDVLTVLHMFPYVNGCYILFQKLWEESRQTVYISDALEA